jgi:hypothetical protein
MQHKSGTFQTLDKGKSLQKVAEKNVTLVVFLIVGDWKRKERGSETGVLPELQNEI